MSTKKTLFLAGAVVVIGIVILGGFLFLYRKENDAGASVVVMGENDTEVHILIASNSWTFEPGEIVLEKGMTYTVRIENEDSFAHGLAIRELDVNIYIPPEETTIFELTPQKTGTFVTYCSVVCGEGHTHMKGKITVR